MTHGMPSCGTKQSQTQFPVLQLRLSQMQRIGNIGIIANFVFPYSYNFVLYSINIELDINEYVNHISRLQSLLAQFICNGTAKTKKEILTFLYCRQIVKNSYALFSSNLRLRYNQYICLGMRYQISNLFLMLITYPGK